MPETNFFWDPLSDNILQERDESGAVTAEYTTEPGLYGNLISQNRGGVESQYHFDAIGSTLAVTDDTQHVTDTCAYSAFGEVTERTGGTEIPIQYVGQKQYYCDADTGEYGVRRRPLSARHARWHTVDPIGLAKGFRSVYVYARNNPITTFDPSGLDEKVSCSAYDISVLLPEPTPWKTADFPKFKKGVLEGYTYPRTWYIECTCRTCSCIDLPEGCIFKCPPGKARMCCKIVLDIPFIHISKTLDEALLNFVWCHEMYHVENYQTKTKEVIERLGKEKQGCITFAECDAKKKDTLKTIGDELDAFARNEVEHKNFERPMAGVYYTCKWKFPDKPIGHEPKPPIKGDE